MAEIQLFVKHTISMIVGGEFGKCYDFYYLLFLFCLFVCFFTQSLQDGPTTLIIDLYFESFGNIEEADMVSSTQQHFFFPSGYLNLILPSYC